MSLIKVHRWTANWPSPASSNEQSSLPPGSIDLIPVVAPGHPLAALKGPIETHVLHRHVQLVLTDRSSLTTGRDYGVVSGRTWRLADLGAKDSMLAGLGWGNMPFHPSRMTLRKDD
jgi:DNA-binding transcriptional LysR family regulator